MCKKGFKKMVKKWKRIGERGQQGHWNWVDLTAISRAERYETNITVLVLSKKSFLVWTFSVGFQCEVLYVTEIPSIRWVQLSNSLSHLSLVIVRCPHVCVFFLSSKRIPDIQRLSLRRAAYLTQWILLLLVLTTLFIGRRVLGIWQGLLVLPTKRNLVKNPRNIS